jgi:nucleoid-associated protein
VRTGADDRSLPHHLGSLYAGVASADRSTVSPRRSRISRDFNKIHAGWLQGLPLRGTPLRLGTDSTKSHFMDFIIHEMLKDANGPVRPRLRATVIEASEREANFLKEVTQLFRKHQSGRVYGRFEEDTTSYPLSGLIQTECLDASDFYTFSKRSAAHFESIIKDIPAATGGYFFVGRFTEEESDLLLIFLLNQNIGHAVNQKTLTLEPVLNLKTEQLDLAARIDITEWKAGRAEPVSLIRGRKDVSAYFKKFIGLFEPKTNTEATKKLKQFTEGWMATHEYAPAQKQAVIDKMLTYAKERGTQPVELDVVAAIVDPERHQEFFNKANESGLGAEFHIDQRSFAGWSRITYTDEDIRLSLAKRQLNTRFVYNADKKTLLIKNITLPAEDLL